MNKPPVSDRKTVEQFYDSNAASYSKQMESEMQDPIYNEVLGRLANNLVNVHGPLLDTSCGSGHMLERYHSFDSTRELLGTDLSPRMVEIARERLGEKATIHSDDMCTLNGVAKDSIAGLVSYFAIQHINFEEFTRALGVWHSVLRPGGQFVLAAWEGEGVLEYGPDEQMASNQYSQARLEQAVKAAGFSIDVARLRRFDEFDSSALYLEATKV